MTRLITRKFQSDSVNGYLKYEHIESTRKITFEYVAKGKLFWGSYSLNTNEVTAWQCNSMNFSNQRTLASRDRLGEGKGKTKEQIRKMIAKTMRM